LEANFWNQSDIERISKDAMWLKLLHYDDSASHSAIHDKSFFLDDAGHKDAKKELLATLEAYNQKVDNNSSNELAICRFPARYFWLSTQLELPEYQELNPICTKLLKWKLLKTTQSISVVFVSGYLGNPASAFGHSFIKVNKNNQNNSLFDTTISYGALLPPKYSMPEYIFNGLTGGYDAAYSDKYYYNQDIIYSNQEFRDMWEYRLNLSEEKKKLFLFHAWELMGKKNQYFFLNRNCGYKVSEFLSLLYDEPLIESAYIWYAPIETFYKLKELDEKSDEPIIDEITYVPSKQQKIYARFEKLSSLEKRILSEMINKELNSIPEKYSEVDSITKAHVLDFLLVYRKYSIDKSKTEIDRNMKELNRALLLKRLKLPVAKGNKGEVKVKEPITTNNAPSYMGLSFLNRRDNKGLGWNFSPFAIEKVGYNDFSGDELVVFDTQVAIMKDDVYLDKFDLIRIQRLKSQQIPYDNENLLSWNFHISTEKNSELRDYFVDGGVGYTWEPIDTLKLFTMLNISLHSDDRHYRYRPNIGIYGDFNRFRFLFNVGYEEDIESSDNKNTTVINSQYRMTESNSIFLEYSKKEIDKFSLGIKYFY
jgi:hypothetical protein